MIRRDHKRAVAEAERALALVWDPALRRRLQVLLMALPAAGWQPTAKASPIQSFRIMYLRRLGASRHKAIGAS